MAIPRTTPALLELFSFVTLFAHQRMIQAARCFSAGSLVPQDLPAFADTLALVRKELWAQATFCGSSADAETARVSRTFVERLTDAVCYVA
jgi:hypothetical protein